MNEELLNLLCQHDDIKGRFIYSPLISDWSDPISQMSFIQDLQKALHNGDFLDLYAHIPFCKELCTFCGCNVKITSQKEVANHFVQNLIQEWKGYSPLLPQNQIRSLTLGGGTPTFLEPETLNLLIQEIDPSQKLWKQIEIDPRSTTQEHFKILKSHKFNRINVGIQDMNNDVMTNVNRYQSPERIAEIFNWAKEYEIPEVFVDLIFGLPGQTQESLSASTKQLLEFSPDFINLYPLVPVPWLSDTQKAYGHFETPKTREKWQLYLTARSLLLEKGYESLGYGHFIHPKAKSYQAIKKGVVSRQLMGILPFKPAPYLGLGPGSLSWSGHMMKQNEKVTEKYLHLVQNGLSTHSKSHLQSNLEVERTQAFQNLFAKQKLQLNSKWITDEKISELGIELMKVIANEISAEQKET